MLQPVILRFTPTQQDYAIVLRHFFMRRAITRLALGVLALAFVVICYMVISRGTPPDLFEWVWLLLVPVFVAYILFIQPSRMAIRAAQNEQLVSEATWDVSDRGVTISSRFDATSLNWDTLARLVNTRGYYLLLIKANRNAFRFIPKRAFCSQAEQDTFLNLIRQHLPTD